MELTDFLDDAADAPNQIMVARFSKRLSRFYGQYDASKLKDVDALVAKYSNQEAEFFAALTKKYGAEPSEEAGSSRPPVAKPPGRSPRRGSISPRNETKFEDHSKRLQHATLPLFGANVSRKGSGNFESRQARAGTSLDSVTAHELIDSQRRESDQRRESEGTSLDTFISYLDKDLHSAAPHCNPPPQHPLPAMCTLPATGPSHPTLGLPRRTSSTSALYVDSSAMDVAFLTPSGNPSPSLVHSRMSSHALHEQHVDAHSLVDVQVVHDDEHDAHKPKFRRASSVAPPSAEDFYNRVAKETFEHSFSTTVDGVLPRRSPYVERKTMGRGSNFSKRFREFVETGGVAAHKNCVAVNIRLNDLRDINSANGHGTFRASFFLDTAFWVPWFDEDHFGRHKTVGTFGRFEPNFHFPGVDVRGGQLQWGLRIAEFGEGSRQHEVQLGQNYTTAVTKNFGGELGKGTTPYLTKQTGAVSVADEKSHWPRMWRVCLDDAEIAELKKMGKAKRKLVEPSNEEPHKVNPRLAELFGVIDEQRKSNLAVPGEGVAYVTYEIHCTHRNEFHLHEFPFDIHLLGIIVQISKAEHDPMKRVIVPVAHDKAFFVSGRVADMVDYHMGQNLDWEVSREPMAFGGFQRITASAIVRRKPGYFIRNYIIVVYLLTTSSFASFMARPDDFNTRVTIIFTVLLAIVSFKYNGAEHPRVPYATIMDAYILLDFYFVLVVAVVSFAFAMQCSSGGTASSNNDLVMANIRCSRDPGRWYNAHWVPEYNPVFETVVSISLFAAWCVYNVRHWWGVWTRIQFSLHVIDRVGIGWMNFKASNGGKVNRRFDAKHFIISVKESEQEDLRVAKLGAVRQLDRHGSFRSHTHSHAGLRSPSSKPPVAAKGTLDRPFEPAHSSSN